MSDVTIRRAMPSDQEAILALWRELQVFNARLEPRLEPSTEAKTWMANFLTEQWDNERTAIFVAVSSQEQEMGRPEIVGYVFGQLLRRPTLEMGDCGYVADLAVRADYRRQGIGSLLYHRMRSWLIGQNVRAVEVSVVSANPAAEAFWRSMGFEDFLKTLRIEL